jgi:hypothetical protein
VKVTNSTNINKTNNNLSPKESLNSEGQQFHNITKTNNNLSPKESFDSDGQQFINKTNNNLSPKEILNSDGQQFHHYPSLFKLSLGDRLLFVLLILVELVTFTAKPFFR